MNYIFNFITPFGLALGITILLIPVWISICRKWHLFDEPDARKHHKNLTPSMGGIAIFAGLFISFLVFAEIHDQDKIRYLFGAALILFFTGFFDDLMDVPPMKKMAFQAISACVVYYGGFHLHYMGGLFGIDEVPSFLQFPLTLFLIVLFTNAYNFIDGVDGLAGSLGVIASSCFGAAFYHYDQFDFAILSFCMTGALLGFLFYNFSPAKIFMGDTGSLVIGFILAVFGIELLQQGALQSSVAVSPSFVFAVLFLPIFDIGRVFIIRMLNGTSPFRADRNHIHHLILSYGFGHRSTALFMAVFSLFFILLQQTLTMISSTEYVVIVTLVALLAINSRVLSRLAGVRKKLVGSGSPSNVPVKAE